MTSRILVVEDEIFVAAEIEHVIEDLGYESAGIVADQKSALAQASNIDIALVDLNLKDGATGMSLGNILAQTHGVTVLYMTANPSQLGGGVPGTLGVLAKPVSDRDLRDAVNYAVARREAADATPPRRLRLFERLGPLSA
jgi:DNA-binding response OmpR family regulator